MPEVYLRTRVDGMHVNMLVSEGRAITFSLRGIYEGEKPFDFSRGELIPVDVLSVLQVGTTYELAMVRQKGFYKKQLNGNVASVLSAVGAISNMVFAGTRTGEVDGVKFTQYVYVFREGKLTSDWLNFFK